MLRIVKNAGAGKRKTYIQYMALSKKTVGGVLALLVLSLAGLVVLQSYLLNFAMEQKEQAFRRNVLAALNTTAARLEFGKVVVSLFQEESPPGDTAGHVMQVQVVRLMSDSPTTDSVVVVQEKVGMPPLPWMDGRMVHYKVNSPQHVSLQLFDPALRRFINLEDTFRLPGIYEIQVTDSSLAEGQAVFRFATDSIALVFQATNDSISTMYSWDQLSAGRAAWVSLATDRLAMDEWQPVKNRIEPATLDSLLSQTLTEAGIDLAYAFAVISSPADSLSIVQPPAYTDELRQSPYRARLFPADLFAPRHELVVYFPGHTGYLWRQMGPLFAATFVLMLVIIICFILAVRTIVVQRRLADRMVGFINNMTHEFKTPISTVALACEAINRPAVLAQQDKVVRYSRMIGDENKRMQGQVEKILQMAVLEKGDYELQLAPIDVHEIIRRAVEGITLQIEHRGGTISCTLEATAHVVLADGVHLTNVINNLLDNANKYSPQAPVVTLSTQNEDEGIVIKITDQGTGIQEKDRKLVFDKYYRVPAGNLHDVKGFGLGLSYVKLMVAAHHGHVSLTSEYGRGTQVTVWLPLEDGSQS